MRSLLAAAILTISVPASAAQFHFDGIQDTSPPLELLSPFTLDMDVPDALVTAGGVSFGADCVGNCTAVGPVSIHGTGLFTDIPGDPGVDYSIYKVSVSIGFIAGQVASADISLIASWDLDLNWAFSGSGSSWAGSYASPGCEGLLLSGAWTISQSSTTAIPEPSAGSILLAGFIMSGLVSVAAGATSSQHRRRQDKRPHRQAWRFVRRA